LFAKDGYPFIFGAAIALVAFIVLPKWFLITVSVLLLLLFLWFFRDPERETPFYDDVAVSSADGVVVDLKEEEFEGNTYKKLSVFMNVFNVHVNRVPVSGKVEKVEHRPGKFMPADREAASMENEQNLIFIETAYGSVIVKQVAGLVARRCVSYLKEDDEVKTGDRLGVIKFSSRVDLYFPLNFEVTARLGDRVTAGETIVGKFNTDVVHAAEENSSVTDEEADGE